MTLNTVWLFITLACIFSIIGGILHSMCKVNTKRIGSINFDFTPLAITLYIIGGGLGFIAMLCAIAVAIR